MSVICGACCCSARMQPAAGIGETAPTPTVSPSPPSRAMTTAMSSSGVYSPDLGMGARLACCPVYPLQVFPVIVHAIDVPIKIGSETRFLSCRLDILSAMSVISFVPETKAARMRSQRHLDHD